MPRGIITLQVGQCGNQIGSRFWDLTLKEHAARGLDDDSMLSFFDVTEKQGEISIKARSLLIDMEESVIDKIMASELGPIFDNSMQIKSTDGSGNNWAVGHCEYGPQYEATLLKNVQTLMEACDSPQCFMLFHSIGGGTGSGLGTFALKTLNENYPELFKFNVSVFPSDDDDVITSPYNSLLAANELINHSDCVLPIDNQSLIDICSRSQKAKKEKSLDKNGKKAFDDMNTIVAHMLANLTCSMRFEGSLNVDINDITMNLVPFPRLHFIFASLSPLYHLLDKKLEQRRVDDAFSEVFSRDFVLSACDNLSTGVYLASALIARGAINLSDINRNIAKHKKHLRMVHWNEEGFKVGLCDNPPVGMNYGLLCLSNHTTIADTFQNLINRFNRLYKKKAHLHHYTNVLGSTDMLENALTNVISIVNDYNVVGVKKEKEVFSFKPAI